MDLDELRDNILSSCRGSWETVLPCVASIDPALLDRRGHPCPLCGGTDRFSFRNFNGDGAVVCRKCNPGGSTAKDGIGAVMWMESLSFPDALKRIAEHLVIVQTASEPISQENILTRVAKLKRVTPESLLFFRCYAAKRRVDDVMYDVLRFPTFGVVDGNIQQVGDFDLGLATDKLRKGMCAYGAEPGVFLPHKTNTQGDVYSWKPHPDKPVYLVEGVKDAAKMMELGYTTIGLPTTTIPKDYWSMFRGLKVYLVPDRDTAGDKGAHRNAALLWGIAKEIWIVRLPVPIKEKDGDGVREIANLKGGPEKLAAAIQSATQWSPAALDHLDVMTLQQACEYWHAQRMSKSLRSWSTGINGLDRSISKYCEGEYIVVAGRPGRGKTAIGLQLSVSHVDQGGVAMVCSEEMRIDELAERYMQRIMHVSREELRDAMQRDASEVRQMISHLSIYDRLLFSSRRRHIDAIVKSVQSAYVTHGVSLVVIDYAQIIVGDGKDSLEKLADVSEKCVSLAKDLGITVVLLAQFNRAAEGNDREPRLSDIKGSGNFEQDADIVLAVDWAGYDDDGSCPKMKIYNLKNRHRGVRLKLVEVAFDPTFYEFDRAAASIRDVIMDESFNVPGYIF